MRRSSKGGFQSPRFFCDNCGAEVPGNEKKCPECGRFFSSVRCPACGFVGEEASFKEGCPVCNYSSSPPKKAKAAVKTKQAVAGLPFWMYILTAAVFTAVLAALFLRVFK